MLSYFLEIESDVRSFLNCLHKKEKHVFRPSYVQSILMDTKYKRENCYLSLFSGWFRGCIHLFIILYILLICLCSFSFFPLTIVLLE